MCILTPTEISIGDKVAEGALTGGNVTKAVVSGVGYAVKEFGDDAARAAGLAMKNAAVYIAPPLQAVDIYLTVKDLFKTDPSVEMVQRVQVEIEKQISLLQKAAEKLSTGSFGDGDDSD